MNSYEIRTNFVRISYEFHVNSREFIQISPLCTPSFVLTPGVPPPQCTPAGTLATCNMCTCVWVCLCVGCVDLCGFVYGCMVGFACGWMHDFLFVSTCGHASVCWCVWGCGGHPTTYAHKPVPNPTPTPTHPHTQPRTHGYTPTHKHAPTRTNQSTHTHTHTHIDTPTMIPPHIPNHDTSTMQVCVCMCGWVVCGCGCGWGGRAASFH